MYKWNYLIYVELISLESTFFSKFAMNGVRSEAIGIPITCLKIEFQRENNSYVIDGLQLVLTKLFQIQSYNLS